MADVVEAIQRIGTYEFTIHGDVTNETEFNNIKWDNGRPSAVTWAKVKADMDKQDSFANQAIINQMAKTYLAETDWYVIRAAEGGTAVPSDITTKRSQERAKVIEFEDFTG
tara:strand:+ start:487 stop:819 length:333 start_codon:yes stop_codon:yes gene_type:complete